MLGKIAFPNLLPKYYRSRAIIVYKLFIYLFVLIGLSKLHYMTGNNNNHLLFQFGFWNSGVATGPQGDQLQTDNIFAILCRKTSVM
jgi:hypothetical protein